MSRVPTRNSAVSTIRTVIVDDEPAARASVRTLAGAAADIEIVAECRDGHEAVERIRALAPDLCFLDVRMPGLDGFDVIREVGLDLMPPTALDRVRSRLQAGEDRELRHRLAGLLGLPGAEQGAVGPLSDPRRWATRIMVKVGQARRFLSIEDVDYIEAAGKRIRIHSAGDTYLLRATLGGTHERLDPRRFVRIHRSTVVNVDRIREVQAWFGGDYVAILEDGTRLKVSRGYRDQLLQPLA